jgi:hypothetical protein
MAIDVITGKYFIPKYQGQRTAVDIKSTGDTPDEILASAQEAIKAELAVRYAGDHFYNATAASMQAEWDAAHEKALITDSTAERHIVTAEEEAQAAGRLGRAADAAMVRLVGGYNPDLDYGVAGPNIFLRTEGGLEGWKGMDRSGQDTGGRVPLNAGYGVGGTSTVIPPVGSPSQAAETAAEVAAEEAASPDLAVDTRDAAAAVEAKYADFVTSLQTVGIDKDFAQSLWDWAKGKLTDPDYPMERIAIDVYDTDAFKQRFPAITEQRKMENVTPFTPTDYIDYEKFVMGQLATHAVTGQNIDFDGLVTSLITNNVGTSEVTQRLSAAKRILGNVPEQVRSTYMDWYGPEAEANLMKTFLDPSDDWAGSWAQVDVATGTAEVGGWIKQRLRFDETESVTKESAGAINRLGLSAAKIWEGLDTLRSQEALFAENIDETTDMTILDEGLSGQFGLDDESEDLLSKRRETRSARFAGGGGALVSGANTGFGAANA